MTRLRLIFRRLVGVRPALLTLAWISTTPGNAFAQGIQSPSGPDPAFRTCEGIQEFDAKLRCADSLRPPGTLLPREDYVANGWRLVRSPNPGGGQDAVSIMHTAEISKSDLDFAGLMLRCSQQGVEALIVTVQPFPAQDHPKVTVETASDPHTEFSASVATPGVLIVLPPAAVALADGPWQGAPELTASIQDQARSLRGVVPLAGLHAALQALRSNCPPQ